MIVLAKDLQQNETIMINVDNMLVWVDVVSVRLVNLPSSGGLLARITVRGSDGTWAITRKADACMDVYDKD